MRRRSTTFGAVALTACLLLSGCSGRPGHIDAGTGSRLQDAVVKVATLAGAHRYAAASDEARSIQRELAGAVAAGRVSADRAVQIQAALDQVRTDLAALAKRTPAVTPVPTPRTTAAPKPKPKHQPKRKKDGDDGEHGDGGD